jgi:hypothetical protein
MQAIRAREAQLLLILDLGTTWGEWSASHTGHALPGKGTVVPIGQEVEWASELVWTQRLEEKSFDSAMGQTPISRSSTL